MDLDKEATQALAKDLVALKKARLIISEIVRKKIDEEMKTHSAYRSLSGKVNPPARTTPLPETGPTRDDVVEGLMTLYAGAFAVSEQGPSCKMDFHQNREFIFYPQGSNEFKSGSLIPVGLCAPRANQVTFLKLPEPTKGPKVAFAMPTATSSVGVFAQGSQQILMILERPPKDAKPESLPDLLRKTAQQSFGDGNLAYGVFTPAVQKSSANAPTSVMALVEGGKWNYYWTDHRSKTETKVVPLQEIKK